MQLLHEGRPVVVSFTIKYVMLVFLFRRERIVKVAYVKSLAHNHSSNEIAFVGALIHSILTKYWRRLLLHFISI